jgi:hypothetical protein
MVAVGHAIKSRGGGVSSTGLQPLLRNMITEIPAAIETLAGELKNRARQTLEGSAPARLPATPILEIVAPSPAQPTISVFSLQSMNWPDERGQRQG